MVCDINEMIGRNWRVCSLDCNREIGMKEACSIMGKEYKKSEKEMVDK